MDFKYADEKNALLIVALLKRHAIKKVIMSPGATNMCLNVSLQYDGSFELYSCIDERSAAYMACGLAAETGEPVVITCTEATASRDYLPGLTEAYHRKLPVLAITGMHGASLIGHLSPQTIDRTVSPADSLRLKVTLPEIKDENDVWESQIKINQAILELKRHGGGPVHMNMPVPKSFYTFTTRELPDVRVIHRYFAGDALPELPEGRIVVFVGSHKPWKEELENAVDCFCARYDAVVFCDHSSKYHGRYAVQPFVLASQQYDYDIFTDLKLIIHIGEEAADEPTMEKMTTAARTWRVSEDGEIRDTFRNLSNVFEMREIDFFHAYLGESDHAENDNYLQKCRHLYGQIIKSIPELPLSNIYVASEMSKCIPEGSSLHLAASNTIRSWSFFELPRTVHVDANMGCRGIDGAVSASVGMSLARPGSLCFCVLGDLTFFYDMSMLGNRHVKGNYRILVINNHGGNIFKQPGHMGHHIGNDNADLYIAAGNHYGGKSGTFICKYAEAAGFRYLAAKTKEEFLLSLKEFVSEDVLQPMIFEVTTADEDEVQAFEIMKHLAMNSKAQLKQQAKKILGDKGSGFVRGILNRS